MKRRSSAASKARTDTFDMLSSSLNVEAPSFVAELQGFRFAANLYCGVPDARDPPVQRLPIQFLTPPQTTGESGAAGRRGAKTTGPTAAARGEKTAAPENNHCASSPRVACGEAVPAALR